MNDKGLSKAMEDHMNLTMVTASLFLLNGVLNSHIENIASGNDEDEIARVAIDQLREITSKFANEIPEELFVILMSRAVGDVIANMGKMVIDQMDCETSLEDEFHKACSRLPE